MAQTYFYDQQIRRWLIQFMRLFGGFSVKMGKDEQGADFFQVVPVRYGDTSRMASHIIRENSENKINTVPFISVYIAELLPNPDRRLNPTHVGKAQVLEKRFDSDQGQFLDEIGESYTLERVAPIPYDLTLNVDIWTSNTEQKLQLLEQILLLFNPSVNLQSSDNPFDWTSLGVVELINTTWSARQIPMGNDDIIDVSSLIYSLPIYLTPPAKIKRQVLIHSILQSVFDDKGDIGLESLNLNFNNNSQRQWITFENRHIKVNSDNIELRNTDNSNIDKNQGSDLLDWEDHFNLHGGFKPGITEIRLRIGPSASFADEADEVILVCDSIVSTNKNLIAFTLNQDTLPIDTILSINGIINPQKSEPGVGNLPAEATGQRYLLVENTIPFDGAPWGTTLEAKENDIVEYNGSEWVVSFNALAVNTIGYTTNVNSGEKLYFDGNEWVVAIEGIFAEGYWRIVN
jgi:hypothetical protein